MIDCDLDCDSQTIVAGDIDGTVALLDARGNLLDSHQVEMPVWGVQQSHGSTHRVAVATADKKKGIGKGYILSGFERTGEFDSEGELWDCAFTPFGICFTSWSSKVLVTDFEGEVTQSIPVPGTPYGISVHGEEVDFVLNQVGVGRLGRNGKGLEVTISRKFPNACYNLSRSANSDLFVTGSKNGRAAILASLTQERVLGSQAVSAVAVHDDLLLAGSLDGCIGLFHLGSFEPPLATLHLEREVWNISLDREAGLAYVACGDGLLHCLQVDLTELSPGGLSAIRSAVRSPIEIEKLLIADSSAEIEVALSTIEEEWDRWSEHDLEAIAVVVGQWADWHASPRLYFVLGLTELECDRSDDAIVLFQSIDRTSEYAIRALLPLARALRANGSLGAAIRLLRMNLERIPESERTEYLFEIGGLHEQHGDRENAVDAYELVSILNHDYPGLQEALERLRGREAPGLGTALELSPDLVDSPQAGTGLGNRRTSEYGPITYFLYEYGSPDEEAKKHLEAELMARTLSGLQTGARSLDIGCATGRWPEWFGRKGYEAHGYDISEASIEICRERAKKNPELPLFFERYDISDGAQLRNYFDIVTCMMGTFNHVPPELRVDFLRGVRESLAPNGHFIASIWNVSSPFCEFLGLDGQQAKETLRRNSLDLENCTKLLRASAFEVEAVTPFCLLPNQCYRVWDDEFRDGIDGLVKIENHLRANLTALSRSQMHFLVAKLGRA